MSTDLLLQIDSLLASTRQSWLLGAGVSIEANIPLMGPLTRRVSEMLAKEPAGQLLEAVVKELPSSAHIEHVLSQIGDYAAIADRSGRDVQVGGTKFSLTQVAEYHDQILRAIAETIRWGYIEGGGASGSQVGSYSAPLVKVADHAAFVRALVGRSRAGIGEMKHPVKLFTTNYDTLLEDALSLESFTFWDGFSGGAVAFRNFRYGDKEIDDPVRAHVIKLHGSIDWHLGIDGKVWRVRDADLYPSKTGRVLIYPQSTKYLATQRDPFAAQFDLFRRALAQRNENLLSICGYSFGDEHINQEIEIAMHHPDNKTTILSFASDTNPVLEKWRNSSWGQRLYIITASGVYVGSEGPLFGPAKGKAHEWWKFAGVTKILTEGAENSAL